MNIYSYGEERKISAPSHGFSVENNPSTEILINSTPFLHDFASDGQTPQQKREKFTKIITNIKKKYKTNVKLLSGKKDKKDKKHKKDKKKSKQKETRKVPDDPWNEYYIDSEGTRRKRRTATRGRRGRGGTRGRGRPRKKNKKDNRDNDNNNDESGLNIHCIFNQFSICIL